MNLLNFALVFCGGGVGAVTRFLVTTHVGARFGSDFPFGTFTVNAVGSFLMGLIMGLLLLATEKYGLFGEPYRLALTVGFLGGLTTFSSFSMETLTLLRGGSYVPALLNVAGNVFVGLALAAIGLFLARVILR